MHGGVYLTRGGRDEFEAFVKALHKKSAKSMDERDIYIHAYERFGIGEAHALREKMMLRALGEGGRLFAIFTPSMTGEAQNALLKVLEEPPENLRAYFMLPAPEMLLPTLRSRMHTFSFEADESASPIDAHAFLKATHTERIELLSVLLPKKKGAADEDDEDDDSPSKRDIAGAISFLSALERTLYQKGTAKGDGVRAIYRARAYLTDKGSLVKSLLEQVALLVPRV